MSAAVLLLAATAPALDGPLQPLSFLVGHCWRGEFKGSGAVDIHCFEPVYDGKHVRDRHEVKGRNGVYKGETLYSWNGESKRVEYVYWNSLGAVMRGSMQPQPSTLVFDNEGKRLPDGTKATFKTAWKYNGSDGYDVVNGEQTVTYRRVDQALDRSANSSGEPSPE